MENLRLQEGGHLAKVTRPSMEELGFKTQSAWHQGTLGSFLPGHTLSPQVGTGER